MTAARVARIAISCPRAIPRQQLDCERRDDLSAARGIVHGIIGSLIIWALVVLALVEIG